MFDATPRPNPKGKERASSFDTTSDAMTSLPVKWETDKTKVTPSELVGRRVETYWKYGPAKGWNEGIIVYRWPNSVYMRIRYPGINEGVDNWWDEPLFGKRPSKWRLLPDAPVDVTPYLSDMADLDAKTR